MPEKRGELVALGVVARPHGVRGEVRVHLYNPESTLLYELDAIDLRKDGVVRRVAIEDARPGGDACLMRLEGCSDRDAADALRGTELCIAREELPPLADDEMYQTDLEGLSVATEDGTRVGTVIRVIEYPSVSCLEVRCEERVVEIPMLERYIVRFADDGVVARNLDELQ